MGRSHWATGSMARDLCPQIRRERVAKRLPDPPEASLNLPWALNAAAASRVKTIKPGDTLTLSVTAENVVPPVP
jgi:hypothetical protein